MDFVISDCVYGFETWIHPKDHLDRALEVRTSNIQVLDPGGV